MKRRSFLYALVVAPLAAALAPHVPAPPVRQKASLLPGADLSVRFLRQYEFSGTLHVSRLDVLYGTAAIRPELACRVQV